MAWIRAQNKNAPSTTNRFAVFALLFYGTFNLHTDTGLCIASSDTAFAAVRVNFDMHCVANKHFNAMKPHLTSKVCNGFGSVLKLHAKKRIWQRLGNSPLDSLALIVLFTHNAGVSYQRSIYLATRRAPTTATR